MTMSSIAAAGLSIVQYYSPLVSLLPELQKLGHLVVFWTVSLGKDLRVESWRQQGIYSHWLVVALASFDRSLTVSILAKFLSNSAEMFLGTGYLCLDLVDAQHELAFEQMEMHFLPGLDLCLLLMLWSSVLWYQQNCWVFFLRVQ